MRAPYFASAIAKAGWTAFTVSAALVLGVPGQAQPTGNHRLVVVELFQSQGCSSCPPANANVNALAGRPDVLALSFAVTYWDGLGWRDTFAKPQFTTRQRDYARAAGRRNVATPHVIVDGHEMVIGNRRHEIEVLIARAARRGDGGPVLSLGRSRLGIGAGAAPVDGADVWLVRYDPQTVQVPIRTGENGGKTLPHRNIVRELTRLGRWTGRPATFAIGVAPHGLATAVLVQAGAGGPILAAART